MSKTSFAEGQLRQIIERIERLENEKKEIAADIAQVKAEAKANGFDVKIINAVIRLRKKDEAERQEEEALLDVYLAALGMTPLEREIQTSVEAKPSRTVETPANGGGMAAGQGSLKSNEPAAQTKAQPVADIPAPESKEQEAPAAGAVYPHCEPAAPFHRYDEAVLFVLNSNKTSLSAVQQGMGIPYAEAAAYMERMEREGIVSAPMSTGKRDILDDDLGNIPKHMDRRKPKTEYTATELLASG